MTVSPPTRTIPDNLADIVGDTPMVRLTRVAPDCGGELVAKLEAYNPGGSVKDRIGVSMIDAAEAEGRIEPGRNTIVESTSGNTGLALAFVCAAKGYDLVITMPQGMSREREKLLRLYGAEVVLVESMGGMNEAVEEARRICRERGNCYVPNQFSNPANPEIHRRTTAEEIWRDLEGKVDVLVAGVGTGGTITGCGERLRERNPDLYVVAVEPRTSAVLSGGDPGPHKIQGIGPGFVPEVLNTEVYDEIVPVDDEDALDVARLCARREGVLAGISGGAALWAADPGGHAAGDAWQASGGDHSRLRRALREHAVLRPVIGVRTFRRVTRELREDLTAAQERDPAARSVGRVETLLTYGGVQALLSHRITHAMHEAGVPLAPRVLANVTRVLTGIEIHPAAKIGRGLFIDHGSGVVIGETAEVGDDVTMYQGVTLGGTGFARGKRHPTVRDEVMIGAGSKLLGPIEVGKRSKIGANSVVIHDVPPNSTVVGNPGHPVRVDGKKPSGPDADWVHLPDPVADAIRGLANRLTEVEEQLADITGRKPESAEVKPLKSRRGPDSTGG